MIMRLIDCRAERNQQCGVKKKTLTEPPSRRNWTRWTLQMAAFVSAMQQEVRKREHVGRVDERTREFDWLAVAIGNLGGPGPAARAMSTSRQTIHNWLDQGVGHVAFDKVALLSQKARVPLELLRRGPWKGEFDLPGRTAE
jgi:hypothetical protein